MAFHVHMQTRYTPWTYIILLCPKIIPKKICLLLYTTFKAILACTHEFWPQTHVHWDVCISPNIFEVFLIWVRITWLLAFQIPWECLDSTLHYLFGVLYKEPLGYIEEEELKSKENIVHCCLSLLILESTSLCPLGALFVLPKISFSCDISIERCWIEVVEAQVEDSVSSIRRCADRGCHSCNLQFY